MSFVHTFERDYLSMSSFLISENYADADKEMGDEPCCPSCTYYGRPDTRLYGQSLHGSLSVPIVLTSVGCCHDEIANDEFNG